MQNHRPEYDTLLQEVADYVLSEPNFSEEAYQTAMLCIMDTMGCGILSLSHASCRRLLGPWVPNTTVTGGVRVPGTGDTLDPIKAAFDIGVMNRYLDYNDTWLAKEWGHPSDNLAAILSVSDYLSQQGKEPLTMKVVMDSLIKAYEIQGILALNHAFNEVGLDHVMLVKVASAALSMHLLGGGRDDILAVLSQAFVDGQSLRTYRHAPNTGSRKSWAAGDAAARAVQLALMTKRGEVGYPSALSAPTWGFESVSFKAPLKLAQPLSDYVMSNILFKVSFPAEFHAQTAVEAAIQLHSSIKDRLSDIESIHLETQEAGFRIIHKTGPLHNPADRDHCLEYMVAIGLLKGSLSDTDYTNESAANPAIDVLREKMSVAENPSFTQDYFDPDKRAISNKVQICFSDGTKTEAIQVDFPLGHRRRRDEAIPELFKKFQANMKTHFSEEKVSAQVAHFDSVSNFGQLSVSQWLSGFLLA